MQSIFALSAILMAILSGSSMSVRSQTSEDAAPEQRQFYQGRWLRAPMVTVDDAPSALFEGVNGEAVVQCIVTDNGSLSRCSVVSETPEGRGFGRSAVKVAQRGRFERPAEGLSDDERIVRTTIKFNMVTR